MTTQPPTPRLPLMLSLSGWPCLIVGGGAVAARRARTLTEAGATVTVVAPALSAGLEALAVRRVERAFEPRDVDGVRLVVVATDNPAVNDQVAAAAAAAGALVNRADGGGGSEHGGQHGGEHAGELSFMATRRDGPLTVAVDSGGASAAAAKTLVQTAADAIGPHWPVLLDEARQRRPALRGDPARLRRLTDPAALDILQRCGRAALIEHLDAVVEGISKFEA